MLVFVDADSQINAPLLMAALENLQSNQVVGGGACVRGDREAGSTVTLTINGWNQASRLFKLAAGCFVYARADAFHAVGGFSQQRYAGEELVLSRNLRRWGKAQGMQFKIITEHTIATSLRKLDWYSPGQIVKQVLLALVPGALGSQRLMRTWYDQSVDRTQDHAAAQDDATTSQTAVHHSAGLNVKQTDKTPAQQASPTDNKWIPK